MKFSKICTEKGIVVTAYFENLDKYSYGEWRPLRNFGWNEGDANIYKNIICPKMKEKDVNFLANHYRENVKYCLDNRLLLKIQKIE